MITQKELGQETPGLLDLYQMGTIAYVKQVVKLPQNLCASWWREPKERSF